MKSDQLLILTCFMALIFAVGSHFGIQSYLRAHRLEAQVQNLTVRTRLAKQQAGELAQKQRVIQRINEFVDHARDMHLAPDEWARYDVNVQDSLSYRELARMLDQCVHEKDFYFVPLSFHVAAGKAKNESDLAGEKSKAAPGTGDADSKETADLALSLKGAFFVRQ
jgi:cell division protein FtsB